jgi:glycerol-3-phosphate O-acyltransferase
MILHFLAVPSFLARELRTGGTREEVVARVDAWLDLLHAELFAARDEAQRDQVDAFLGHFAERGWIAEEGDVLRATPEGVSDLAFLAEPMRAVIESYYVAFSAVARIDEPVGRKALRKQVAQQFERLELLGEARLPEAKNEVSFGNAIDWLVARGVLAPSDASGGDRRDPPVGRGPSWDELAGLRRRLATALDDR